MLDVHVLVADWTPKEWVEQCKQSIDVALSRVPEGSVQVHYLPAVYGDIAIGRKKGFALGSNPYCSYVDDDDYLMPDAFVKTLKALELEPAAVFCRELLHKEDGSLSIAPMRRHHPLALRREFIEDRYVEGDHTSSVVRNYVSNKGTVVDLYDTLYVWRISNTGRRSGELYKQGVLK